MAQSGYTPILIYASGTAAALPSAANLTSSANGAELALNYADGKLYYKNSSGVVTLLASAAAASGTSPGGSTTQVQYNNAGAFAGSANLTFDGTTLTANGNTVITSSGATDALRITQTGSGNALLVEDSTNPDATPFVVDANGVVGIGTTTPQSTFSLTAGIGLQSTATFTPIIVQRNKANDSYASYFIAQKDRAGAIVQSGDAIGNVLFQAFDGASMLDAARIGAFVDGTPGTNDMPGRLVFSTTADGASSPTERMRITSAGNVGIGGGAPFAYQQLGFNGTAPSSGLISEAVSVRCTLSSASTSSVDSFLSRPTTEATSYTLSSLRHFRANPATFGAGSTVSNQYGFIAESSLTGATNNYGFYSNIASGTGRYNFYAGDTADNYFAGRVGIGGLPFAGANFVIPKTVTGATNSYQLNSDYTVASDVTSSATTFFSYVQTQAAAFTLGNLNHFFASQRAIGAGSTITNQYGFVAESTLTGATNNYGFLSSIASGTGRWNFYAGGTAQNYFEGLVGLKTTANNGGYLEIGGTANVVSNSGYGVTQYQTIPSTATSQYWLNTTVCSTAAASFTLSDLRHYNAGQGTFGAGSTVTSQYGFFAQSNLTGATNNYGFYSNIASGTGRWNFYANGTADNYFAGNVGIGLAPVANNGILQLGSYGSVKALMETATVSATAATGTINYDAATQAVVYYTSNASANWTVNFRGSASLSLNSMMQTGQSLTLAFLVTQGATAYYNSAVQVDGTSVTPKWQGGTAPSSGNASSIDIYSYTIVKTGSAAFTVFASQTKFA